MELDIQLLKWQQSVWNDSTRFKVVAAGRRTGKSRLAAYMLIVNALQTKKGHVWYIANTQGQARDVMWSTLLEIAHPVIESSHINNLQIKLINGTKISLKGADRPETMRGVSLKFVVLDEYGSMKSEVWETIIRPSLADQKGSALFIGTPFGRNHFYDLYNYADSDKDKEFKAWHYSSFDNELLDPKEIEAARKSMSSYAFRQEFMASFEAASGGLFKEDWIQYDEQEPEKGRWYISCDIGGFTDVAYANTARKKRLDQTAIAIVKIDEDKWWIHSIEYGRWTAKKTASKIFQAVADFQPLCVGIEKGIAQRAVVEYMQDMMRQYNTYFRIEETSHKNRKKIDRITWALQGRLEHGKIFLNKGSWNHEFLDQLLQFPNLQVHDDLIDALSYIAEIQIPEYMQHYEEEEFEPLDIVAGY
tara:strand:+ start:188 stop:1441 length:1254 start_codon:yes stop_codon:yes gene_type:complete